MVFGLHKFRKYLAPTRKKSITETKLYENYERRYILKPMQTKITGAFIYTNQ